jgi:hypothetical protein
MDPIFENTRNQVNNDILPGPKPKQNRTQFTIYEEVPKANVLI